LNVVYPESVTISAGQMASFYCTSGVEEENIAWFVDWVFFGNGYDLEVDSSVGVGEHEVSVLIAYWYGDDYQIFDSNRAQLIVLSSSLPTPTPTQTAMPTSTATPYPTATVKPSYLPFPTASSNPIDDFFNDDSSVVQNDNYKVFAGIASFPLISLGFVTVFVARKKR
jgi:hypothetical protein